MTVRRDVSVVSMGLLACALAVVGYCQEPAPGAVADKTVADKTVADKTVADKTVYAVLYDSNGCAGCGPGIKAARAAVAKCPGAQLVIRNASVPADFELFELLAERGGLQPTGLTTAPAIFVGRDYLDMKSHTEADAIALIRKYEATGTGRFFEVTPQELAYAQSRHLQRFRHFSAAVVLVAGLIDGINPCAFTTIIFFVSYLLWFGYDRRDILHAGLAFALGLFLPYYALGAGLLAAGNSLATLPGLRVTVFTALAAVAAVLGVLSLRDAWLARRGQAGDMTLKLPRLLQRRVHEAVKRGAHGGVVVGALLAGLMIAGLEAICTGQIYLPTLVYIAGLDAYQAQAMQYLLLYNLAFITPLLVLVGLMYAGVSSRAVAAWAAQHVAATKLASAAVFLLLAVVMFLAVHPL